MLYMSDAQDGAEVLLGAVFTSLNCTKGTYIRGHLVPPCVTGIKVAVNYKCTVDKKKHCNVYNNNTV